VVATNVPAKLTRLLVLAHHLDALIANGDVADFTQLAAATGLSRARITQIMNLTLLAPDIQSRILGLTTADGERLTERTLRRIAAHRIWYDQRGALTIAPPLSRSTEASSGSPAPGENRIQGERGDHLRDPDEHDDNRGGGSELPAEGEGAKALADQAGPAKKGALIPK